MNFLKIKLKKSKFITDLSFMNFDFFNFIFKKFNIIFTIKITLKKLQMLTWFLEKKD